MKNPVRLLGLMLVAAKAIQAVKKNGGEEGFKFFLSLVGLEQVVESPAKPAAQASIASAVEVVPVMDPAANPITVKQGTPPGTVILPVRSAPIHIDRPARVLGEIPVPRKHPQPPPSGDFAMKLNGVAKQLGLEDKSLLGQFRKLFNERGQGKEYWDKCREILFTVLKEGLLKEESDWELVIRTMKRNLFFIDRQKGPVFLAACPKEILAGLVMGQDGFLEVLGRIRNEVNLNSSSVYRISFMIDACLLVGEEAKGILSNCKDTVNRLHQRQFIDSDHWLIQKVKGLKRPQVPNKKCCQLEDQTEEPAAPVLSEAGVVMEESGDPVKVVDVDSLSEKELDRLTTPDQKPDTLGSEFDRQFAEAMLASEGSADTSEKSFSMAS